MGRGQGKGAGVEEGGMGGGRGPLSVYFTNRTLLYYDVIRRSVWCTTAPLCT